MQAQECFNQPRPALPPIQLPPLPLLAGGVCSACFSGGAADFAAGAGGGAGKAAAVSAGGSTAQVLPLQLLQYFFGVEGFN